MNLRDGSHLFLSLVRAADLDTEVEAQALATWDGVCERHGETAFLVDEREEGVCIACVTRSRALAEIGREGGRKGGRVLSPRKLLQLRRASRKAKRARKAKKAIKNQTATASPAVAKE